MALTPVEWHRASAVRAYRCGETCSTRGPAGRSRDASRSPHLNRMGAFALQPVRASGLASRSPARRTFHVRHHSRGVASPAHCTFLLVPGRTPHARHPSTPTRSPGRTATRLRGRRHRSPIVSLERESVPEGSLWRPPASNPARGSRCSRGALPTLPTAEATAIGAASPIGRANGPCPVRTARDAYRLHRVRPLSPFPSWGKAALHASLRSTPLPAPVEYSWPLRRHLSRAVTGLRSTGCHRTPGLQRAVRVDRCRRQEHSSVPHVPHGLHGSDRRPRARRVASGHRDMRAGASPATT